MENQIAPNTEVAELELEAVIGFNGEAMSMFGLGGLGEDVVKGHYSFSCTKTSGSLPRSVSQ